MTSPDVSCARGEPIRSRVGSGPWCIVIVASVVAALAMAAPTKSHAQGASFQGLGFLPNSTSSPATGVNAFGTAVVGQSGNQAFRWVDGTMTGLGFLFGSCGPTAARGSNANAVNADGTVVVGSSSSVHISCIPAESAFRWTASGGMADLGGLPLAICGPSNAANGVNADGTVVVGRSRHAGDNFRCYQEAFRWVNGLMTGLGFLPGGGDSFVPGTSVANGVNADGSVVVGQSTSGSGLQAFLWTQAGGMAGLGFLPGGNASIANGVNADGTVVVGSSDSSSGHQAFRWVGGAMTGLGTLPGGSSSDAFGVNGDGTVVVGTSVKGGRNFAVRWTPTDGMRSVEDLLAAAGVNVTGWQLASARGVSGDGTTIVGEGIDPGGLGQGWIAKFFRLLTCPLVAQLGDFNADSRADILYQRTDGTLLGALMNGLQVQQSGVIGQLGPDWRIGGVGDFTGDGKADILFKRSTDGAVLLLVMNGLQVQSAPTVAKLGPEWKVAGVGSFKGDGRADILFRRSTDGALLVVLMNGTQIQKATNVGAIGLEWTVYGVRDFNGDGTADILFRRSTDGAILILLMQGDQVLSATIVGAIGTEWQVAGVGDFDGDRKADILFRRATDGTVLMLLMDGAKVKSAPIAAKLGPEWVNAGVGDVSGDGMADIVFRRTTDGAVLVLLMNGPNLQQASIVAQLGSDWSSCFQQPTSPALNLTSPAVLRARRD